MGLWSLQIFHGVWGKKKNKNFCLKKKQHFKSWPKLSEVDRLPHFSASPSHLLCHPKPLSRNHYPHPCPFTHTHTHTQVILLCQLTFRRLTSNLPKGIPAPIHPQPLHPPASLSISLPAAPVLWILAQQVAPLQSPLGIRGLSGVPESCNYTTTQVI